MDEKFKQQNQANARRMAEILGRLAALVAQAEGRGGPASEPSK